MASLQRLAVFCGSSIGARPAYGAAARALGEHLLQRKIGLVYGGAKVGLMGEVARVVRQGGGEVIGVIPESLRGKEIAYTELADLRVVRSMHERKALMADISDGFLALPGGAGTWEELLEVYTWAQLGDHRKPCGLLNVEGYYSPLVAMIERAVADRFISPQHQHMLLVEGALEVLLDRMEAYEAVATPKWIDHPER